MEDITLDFETYYDDKYSLSRKNITTMDYIRDPKFEVLGVGIKHSSKPTVYYRGDKMDVACKLLRTIQNTKGINLIGHNLKFDGLILHEIFGIKPSFYSDTAAMAKGLWPHFPSNLEAVCKRVFPEDSERHKGHDLVLYKGVTLAEIIASEEGGRALKTYCIQDCDITYEIYKQFIQWIPQPELNIINITTRMFVEPQFVLDVDMMKQTAKDAEQRKKDIIQKAVEFGESLGIDFEFTPKTFSSPIQYPALFKAVGLTLPRKISPSNGKETWATAKADVAYINFKADNYKYKPFFDAREIAMSNIAKTRALKLIQGVKGRPNNDNKLVVPLVYYGAHTGRYGGNEGLNLQNLQRGSNHRKALTAPKGKLVYVADSAQIEARTLAWFAGQQDLVTDFATGGDTYATLATNIYGFRIQKAHHPEERSVGKVARLGLGYGMGWKTFQRTLQSGPMGMDPIPCTNDFARKIVTTYRNTHPKIVQSWRTAESMLYEMRKRDCCIPWGCLTVMHNCVRLPNGMFLHFPNLRAIEIETAQGPQYETVYDTYSHKSKRMEQRKIYGGKFIENIMQALSQIIIKEQFARIDERLRLEFNGMVTLQVHDEIIAIASDSKPDDVMSLMYDVMNTPPAWAKGLPLDSEGGYDTCYSK